MIYAAPSIRGPHSPLAGKHCCEEHNAATAKAGDACCHFKSPGSDSLVRLLPRRVAYCNCLLSFPVKIAVFILIFQALGRGYGTTEIGR